MASFRRHGIAAAAAALFAVGWTFPLVLNLSTHIPGPGAGDNVTFLWNFWWMRTALAAGVDPFYTTAVFAPVGTDLTLHTHTMLPALVGATALGALPVATALNLTILAGVALNAFCAYFLAWRVTRDYAGALVAGLVFGGAPYFGGHLYGHFNLTMAWTIPLFALAAIEGLRGSRTHAIVAGVVLGLTAYIDYYYVVFQGALLIVLSACLDRDWSLGPRVPRSSRVRTAVAVLIAVDVILIIGILMIGGFELSVAGRRLSLHTIFNPLQVLWLLVAIWLWLRFRPAVAVTRAASWPGVSGRLLITIAAFAVVASPVIWHGARLVARGEYVTQRYFWRSAPAGIDAATLVLGNPVGGVTRGGSQYLYERLGIDQVESTAWLGIVPIALALFAIRKGLPSSRIWAVVGAVFLLWACGAHLMLFGANTGMVLPQAALRYVPLLGNARIPGRAMVIVSLSLSVRVAMAIAAWPSNWMRRRTFLALVIALIVQDYLPAPIPLTALEHPALYETLRDRPEQGAVCELPMGIRDGFAERGLVDHRRLAFQSIHGRAMTGGFVARLPPSVMRAYEKDPLLSALLSLSSPNPTVDGDLPDRNVAAERLRANGIAFVMLNRRLSPPALIDYVERTLPLELVAKDEERSLYAVVR